jgi:3-methyladenine DNA glycosylase AlkD
MDLTSYPWNNETYPAFLAYLQSLGEEDYKKFNSNIIPDTPHAFGIRVTALRRAAKEILKGSWRDYLQVEKGDFHEEVILEGLVMAGAKCGYGEMLGYMQAFSGKIYNWAICDTVSFKGIQKNKEQWGEDADWFIDNENPWAVRMGFNALMSFYLTGEYIDAVLDRVARVDSPHYYVQMVQAWLVATAFAKCRAQTLAFLERAPMNAETTNKAVRKIRESLRVSKADKDMVLRFKR